MCLICVQRFEHAKRSPDCGFLQMKSPDELTAVDFFRLEHGRMVNYLVRKTAWKNTSGLYFKDGISLNCHSVYNFILSQLRGKWHTWRSLTSVTKWMSPAEIWDYFLRSCSFFLFLFVIIWILINIVSSSPCLIWLKNITICCLSRPHGGSVMQDYSLDPCSVMRGALNPSSICSAFPQILTKSCRRLTELNKWNIYHIFSHLAQPATSFFCFLNLFFLKKPPLIQTLTLGRWS